MDPDILSSAMDSALCGTPDSLNTPTKPATGVQHALDHPQSIKTMLLSLSQKLAETSALKIDPVTPNSTEQQSLLLPVHVAPKIATCYTCVADKHTASTKQDHTRQRNTV
jgi:hypothetical protein